VDNHARAWPSAVVRRHQIDHPWRYCKRHSDRRIVPLLYSTLYVFFFILYTVIFNRNTKLYAGTTWEKVRHVFRQAVKDTKKGWGRIRIPTQLCGTYISLDLPKHIARVWGGVANRNSDNLGGRHFVNTFFTFLGQHLGTNLISDHMEQARTASWWQDIYVFAYVCVCMRAHVACRDKGLFELETNG